MPQKADCGYRGFEIRTLRLGKDRNNANSKVKWQFKTYYARTKLTSLYPKMTNS